MKNASGTRRVLIFGGSFDPPHAGHALLWAAALRALRPQHAYVLPSFHSPFKSAHNAPAADRKRMAELLAARAPRGAGKADFFEFNRGRTTYTFEALRHFQARHPGAELWFLAGSDSMASVPRWKHADRLRRSLRWIVGRRPGNDSAPRGYDVRMMPGRFPDISSTEIRSRFLADLKVTSLLPTEIEKYIRRRGLYGLSLHREIQSTLRPERYRHTLEVARLALRLARIHGTDSEAAATAGLLHDCGRRFNPAEMVHEVRRRGLPVPHLNQIERHAPILAHAYLSADLARRRFGIRDLGILSAIRNHTLGEAGMPFLDRLLFVADLASEDRGFKGAARIRRAALRDLDEAFVEAVSVKLRHVVGSGQWLHPRSVTLWNWAQSIGDE